MQNTKGGSKTLREIFAALAGKTVTNLAKITGRQGTSIGGSVALKISPDVLSWFSSKVKNDIIFVTGTNGKTSTNNMIYSIIHEAGYTCACNHIGANMEVGLISAFIDSSSIFNPSLDFACMEVDEASLPKAAAHAKPDIIVFTNIFPDQSDRYVEIDALLNKIKEGLEASADITLLINADDPFIVSIGDMLPNPKKYYGIEGGLENISEDKTEQAVLCKKCGSVLSYDCRYYGQLGHYTCSKCDFCRPVPDFSAVIENKDGAQTFKILDKDKNPIIKMEVDIRDTYTIYNMTAAASCALIAGISAETVVEGLKKYKPQAGRMEEFYIQKPILLNLAKNPVGFNESMKAISKDEKIKTVVIGVNDLPQDGRDVSWLWDTDFEILKKIDDTITNYILFGRRRYDIALRLKYAGIDTAKFIISETLEDVVNNVVETKSEIGYIISNYSLTFDIRKILKERDSK